MNERVNWITVVNNRAGMCTLRKTNGCKVCTHTCY